MKAPIIPGENKPVENKNVQAPKKRFIKRPFTVAVVIIAILSSYGSFYFYTKYQALKADPNAESAKQTAVLVGTLGKLMELPANETPTVATISDKEKLKGQPFFAMAENGDILFAYTTSMKAILYRPSTNKIINVAPISINQQQDITAGAQKATTSTTSTTPTTTVKKK